MFLQQLFLRTRPRRHFHRTNRRGGLWPRPLLHYVSSAICLGQNGYGDCLIVFVFVTCVIVLVLVCLHSFDCIRFRDFTRLLTFIVLVLVCFHSFDYACTRLLTFVWLYSFAYIRLIVLVLVFVIVLVGSLTCNCTRHSDCTCTCTCNLTCDCTCTRHCDCTCSLTCDRTCSLTCTVVTDWEWWKQATKWWKIRLVKNWFRSTELKKIFVQQTGVI